MKIDLRFTLESEKEEHRKALNFYNNLRRKNRVDVFVELTRQFWDKEIIDGGESLLSQDSKTSFKMKFSENDILPQTNSSSVLSKRDEKPRKKNPLFG